MTVEPVIEARNLHRHYRVGPATVRALDGVDLDVAPGEFLAVVGVSGSGKSTLLHLVGALDTPDGGTLRVAHRDLDKLSEKERAAFRGREVGFIFQAFHLVPSLTASANVAAALTFRGIYGSERQRRTLEALQRVGLESRATHRPSQLSGGEQQRVAIARAMVNRPAILLADEPTGNLDRSNALEVVRLLRELNDTDRTTVLLVTHDEEMASRVAHRMVRLRDGTLS
jgi:putative ABC transport system ATP-binding protein